MQQTGISQAAFIKELKPVKGFITFFFNNVKLIDKISG